MAKGKKCPNCNYPMNLLTEKYDKNWKINVVTYQCASCGKIEKVNESQFFKSAYKTSNL